jgi:hypothetical protein
MKSVTIKDKKGKLLIKVLEHKDGTYTTLQLSEFDGQINIEIRDDKGCKVMPAPNKKG